MQSLPCSNILNAVRVANMSMPQGCLSTKPKGICSAGQVIQVPISAQPWRHLCYSVLRRKVTGHMTEVRPQRILVLKLNRHRFATRLGPTTKPSNTFVLTQTAPRLKTFSRTLNVH